MNQGMIVQKIPVSEINPAKYNPRKDLKPGDPAYEKLKRSMTEFGYVEPIIWNEETGNIVGGHQRYKILLKKDIPKLNV
jgi:ParB-like chromosome segregation protein Spo0J